MTTQAHQLLSHNGFRWVYDEDDGAHYYQKDLGGYKDGKNVPVTYLLIRLLPSDLTQKDGFPSNFEFMCERGLTNTNRVQKHKIV